jgi:hypothetical protein
LIVGTSASGGQVVAHLVHLGTDFRQGLDGVVVQLEPRGDGGKPQSALGFDIVDAVGRGDGPLQRGGDKSAHQIRTGADINRGDRDHGIVAAGVLADIEGSNRLQAGNDDQEADHQRQHGSADKGIGYFHGPQPISRCAA